MHVLSNTPVRYVSVGVTDVCMVNDELLCTVSELRGVCSAQHFSQFC